MSDRQYLPKGKLAPNAWEAALGKDIPLDIADKLHTLAERIKRDGLDTSACVSALIGVLAQALVDNSFVQDETLHPWRVRMALAQRRTTKPTLQ